MFFLLGNSPIVLDEVLKAQVEAGHKLTVSNFCQLREYAMYVLVQLVRTSGVCTHARRTLPFAYLALLVLGTSRAIPRAIRRQPHRYSCPF